MASNVAVIGTVFIDCKGFSERQFNPAGRNLGQVKFFHGGVGRNVAETLARLEVPVTFVSMVDRSGIGEEVLDRLARLDMDLRRVSRTQSQGMGFWLALLDHGGELAGAISQMPDLASLEAYVLERGAEIVAEATDIVLELDLNACIAKHVVRLAKAARKPVYGIPGNLSVVLANPEVLSAVDCFICNDIEAAKLLDIRLDRRNRGQIIEHLKEFVDSCGLHSMVITLGGDGSVYYDSQSGESGYQPVFPVKVVETSGAGDSFFSGTVMGLTNRQPLSKAVAFGTKVAAWTIQSPENVCHDLKERKDRDELFQTAVLSPVGAADR